MSLLKNVRTQSVAKQKRFAIILSGVLTLAIFGFWFVGWRELEIVRSGDGAAEMDPFNTVAQAVDAGYKNFQNQVSGSTSPWAQLAANIGQFGSTSVATTSDATTTASTSTTTSASTTTDTTE